MTMCKIDSTPRGPAPAAETLPSVLHTLAAQRWSKDSWQPGEPGRVFTRKHMVLCVFGWIFHYQATTTGMGPGAEEAIFRVSVLEPMRPNSTTAAGSLPLGSLMLARCGCIGQELDFVTPLADRFWFRRQLLTDLSVDPPWTISSFSCAPTWAPFSFWRPSSSVKPPYAL